MTYEGNLKQKESLSRIAYNLIKEEILNCKLKPGTPITEFQIIEKLGMSRTPVREALSALKQEGYVTLIPRKGWFVSEISLKDIQEIFVIRQGLEGIAARLAATMMSDEKLSELNKYMNAIDVEFRKNSQLVDPGDKIHDYIIKSINNLRMEKVLLGYDNYLKIFNNVAVKLPKRSELSFNEHKEILKALNDRDGDMAEKRMKEHLESTKNSIFTAVANGQAW